MDQIRFRTFGVDLAMSVRLSVWLVRTITLEGSIRFGPNLVHRNIFVKLRSSSEMGNIGPLLLVPPPQKVEIFKKYIFCTERERIIRFCSNFANPNICISARSGAKMDNIGPLHQVPPPQRVKILNNYNSYKM